jgi:hypothetical protein
MSFSLRRIVGAIAVGTLAAVTLTAPAAHASSVLWYKTGYVWTGPSALTSCSAFGQQKVANGDWDAYRCSSDTPATPDTIRAWMGIWVGCPTCAPPGD